MRKLSFLSLQIFVLCCSITIAQEHKATPVADDASHKLETPPSSEGAQNVPKLRFTIGYDQRFRNEDWSNIQDQSSRSFDEIKWNIFRQRLWFKLELGNPNVEFYFRLLNQFKKNSTPSVPLNLDEVVFDNLYFNFTKTFIPGLSIKVGRQDISFGEGFVVQDGSAVDGPRTGYFNAIDIAYSWKKSKLDLIGILSPRQDRFLPIIHKQPRYMNETDEQGVLAYYTDRNRENTDLDLYYILKKEINDYRPDTFPAFAPDRRVNTLGGRIVRRFGHGVTSTGEFAFQKGRQQPDSRVEAWGGLGHLKKEFQAKWKPYLLGGYIVFSGDDPSTPNKYEGWDPLFSRWPKWSGMYSWSLVPEKGIAYWTNSRMVQAEAGFTPWKPLTLRGILYLNDAFHPYIGNSVIFAKGTRRGLMPEIIANYSFGHSIVGEFRYEMLMPGDFYTGRDSGKFFRFEINYSWKHPIE